MSFREEGPDRSDWGFWNKKLNEQKVEHWKSSHSLQSLDFSECSLSRPASLVIFINSSSTSEMQQSDIAENKKINEKNRRRILII